MCDPNNHKAKFCTGKARETCGHPVEMHDIDKGCTQLVESSISEDHWICGCRCVICIHLHLERIQEERKKQLLEQEHTIVIQKQQQQEEETDVLVEQQIQLQQKEAMTE